METFAMSKEDIESNVEAAKLIILGGLVHDSVMTQEAADKWAANHTIIFRKKPFFRRLINAVKNPDTNSNDYSFVLVKLVAEVD